MFKKTINEIKDAVAETEHNVNVTVTVDVQPERTAKVIIKTVASVVALSVTGHLAVALIDAQSEKPKKPRN